MQLHFYIKKFKSFFIVINKHKLNKLHSGLKLSPLSLLNNLNDHNVKKHNLLVVYEIIEQSILRFAFFSELEETLIVRNCRHY